MADSYTVTTTKSWGQRIKEALVGLIIGPIIICISTIVLWNNEGRSAHMIAGLNEGKSVVQEANPLTLDPDAHGGLIHISKEAVTEESLTDSDFSLNIPALALERKVEMYQWHEDSKSSSQDNYGGSESTTTTYTYKKEWSDDKIDSSDFHTITGHENPPAWTYDQKSLRPKEVQVGYYTLTSPMIARIGAYASLQLSTYNPTLKPGEIIHNNTIYIGKDPANPAIGDVRISYTYTPNNTILSILGKQEAPNLLTSYIAKSKSDISRIEMGTRSAEEMFLSAENENTFITWIYRAFGLIFLFVGFSLFFRILPILLKFFPPLAWVAGAGVGLIAFLLTVLVGGGTIALAWIFYRPLISIIIVGVMGGIGYFVYTRYQKKKEQTLTENPPSPPSYSPPPQSAGPTPNLYNQDFTLSPSPQSPETPVQNPPQTPAPNPPPPSSPVS